MRDIWSRLVRGMSQAFWAGYSPNILQWENDAQQGRTILTKVKDLIPEEASVNWKEVEAAVSPNATTGSRPQRVRVFDGIKQAGVPGAVPTTNSLWYPLLMENGNYAGRKLLKSAFQPWFFSTLMHLFSNRYFERFGEPIPVGRAPLNDSVKQGDKNISGTDYMGQMLQSIRSRAAVVLPSDRAPDSSGNLTSNYDYSIEYLESQMRGADFERYMTRLDEEISLALFTPLLLMRTADVGSYNLGVSHMQMYLWELNAIAGDWAEYINKYILAPMARFNFGTRAALPKIVFHRVGKTQNETNKAILSELVKQGKVKVDLVELGQATGLTLEEVDILNGDTEVTATTDPAETTANSSVGDAQAPFSAASARPTTSTIDRVVARVASQATRAHARGGINADWVPDIGFASHYDKNKIAALQAWHVDVTSTQSFTSDEDYVAAFAEAAAGILEG